MLTFCLSVIVIPTLFYISKKQCYFVCYMCVTDVILCSPGYSLVWKAHLLLISLRFIRNPCHTFAITFTYFTSSERKIATMKQTRVTSDGDSDTGNWQLVGSRRQTAAHLPCTARTPSSMDQRRASVTNLRDACAPPSAVRLTRARPEEVTPCLTASTVPRPWSPPAARRPRTGPNAPNLPPPAPRAVSQGRPAGPPRGITRRLPTSDVTQTP